MRLRSNGYLRANGSLRCNKCARSARKSQNRPCWHTGQQTVHVRCAPDTQAGPQVRSSNGQNPTAVMTWQGHRTVRCAPDCPVCQRSNVSLRRQRLPAVHLLRAQRAQTSGTPMPVHRTSNSTCPVCTGHPGGPTSQKLQRSESNGSDDVAGAPDMSGVHRTVRCAIEQTASQRPLLVVWAINTPTTPPFIASKFSTSQLLQEL